MTARVVVRRIQWKKLLLAATGLAALCAQGAGSQTSEGKAAPQAPEAAIQLPAFEVATIRQTPPSARGDAVWSPPGNGKFMATNVSLAFLIKMAFEVDDNQILEKPSWLESELYDVVAKAESDVPLTRAQLRPRLQHLLQQRFHLVTHRETRMVHGYALVVAKGGAKLKPTKGDHWPGFRVHVGAGELNGLNWSMPTLAAMLRAPAGLPVIDKTGIAGSYDIKLDFAPDLEADSSLPSLFTALQETLGLKLESQKVPVEMLMIDHVERVPSEN
jgi:uncharacterized protein (TIGR03435 family)